MCFGEVLPPFPSPGKWQIGGPSHCYMPMVTKYPPSTFITSSVVILSHCWCHCQFAVLFMSWWGTNPSPCFVQVVELLCDWKRKGKKWLFPFVCLLIYIFIYLFKSFFFFLFFFFSPKMVTFWLFNDYLFIYLFCKNS